MQVLTQPVVHVHCNISRNTSKYKAWLLCVSKPPAPQKTDAMLRSCVALVRTFRAPQMCTITLMYLSTPKSPSSFLLLSSLAPIKLDPFFTWEDHLIFLLSLHVENWTSTESPLSSLFSYAVSPPSLLAAISETKLKQQPLAGIPSARVSQTWRIKRQNCWVIIFTLTFSHWLSFNSFNLYFLLHNILLGTQYLMKH